MRVTRRLSIALSLGLNDDPPTEFRLFVSGWNKTENGTFLFDQEAAAAVMAAHQKWGVDVAIDLEHGMLEGPSADPTSRDARGWCQLELRADGSLWAVNVRWTPDGAARLADKRQRYVSPAFEVDRETKRVTKIINVAITSIPATHRTPALVAASVGACMDPKAVQEALDALIAGDSEKCAELLKSMIAAAASGDPDAATEDAPPPVGDAGADEATESAAPPPPPPAGSDEEKKAATVAASRLVKLSGKANITEALADVEVWRQSHLAVEKERAKLAADRATLEAAERRSLCIELIKLGAQYPSTVWADDKSSALKPRWTKMPIEDLRSDVAEQRAARGGKTQVPRGTAAASVAALSAHELALCKEAGCDPAVFVKLKAPAAARQGA